MMLRHMSKPSELQGSYKKDVKAQHCTHHLFACPCVFRLLSPWRKLRLRGTRCHICKYMSQAAMQCPELPNSAIECCVLLACSLSASATSNCESAGPAEGQKRFLPEAACLEDWSGHFVEPRHFLFLVHRFMLLFSGQACIACAVCRKGWNDLDTYQAGLPETGSGSHVLTVDDQHTPARAPLGLQAFSHTCTLLHAFPASSCLVEASNCSLPLGILHGGAHFGTQPR